MDWRQLTQERADLVREGDALLAAARDAGTLTEAQAERDDQINARIDEIDGLLARIQRAREREIGVSVPAESRDPEGSLAGPVAALPTPFRSFGEQLQAVAHSSGPGARTDPRLAQIQAAAQGMNESTPSEGGFLVQPDYSGELLAGMWETGIILPRTRRRTVSGSGLRINAIDEQARTTGNRAGGITAYWTGEAATMTATRPKLRRIGVDLEKLTGVYYATDELLMDAGALESEVRDWFESEFGFRVDEGLVRGSGTGQPLGVLNAACLVTQAAEGGQTADTINATNIAKMYARMPSRSVGNAVWHIPQAAFPQLFLMTLSNQPIYLPGGNLASAPFGLLLGRPVIPIEQCSALGDVGDILFADWSQYLVAEKGGIQTATSIHVQFLTGETAFRFTMRLNGEPVPNAAITPYLGTDTLSPFVTLAAR